MFVLSTRTMRFVKGHDRIRIFERTFGLGKMILRVWQDWQPPSWNPRRTSSADFSYKELKSNILFQDFIAKLCILSRV